jgi:hypothetical protein
MTKREHCLEFVADEPAGEQATDWPHWKCIVHLVDKNWLRRAIGFVDLETMKMIPFGKRARALNVAEQTTWHVLGVFRYPFDGKRADAVLQDDLSADIDILTALQ